MQSTHFFVSTTERHPFCHDIQVQIHQGTALLGWMQLRRVSLERATRAGVNYWTSLEDSSCAMSCGEELEELLHLTRPETLLILESFERAQAQVRGERSLTALAAELFEKYAGTLATEGALLLTYPFPLDVYDEAIAQKLARLYEREWGMSTPLPQGQLRIKVLREADAESMGCPPVLPRECHVGSVPRFH